MQAQLLHAQKMESAGRLAGGIDHDFNNILAIIMDYAELLNFKLRFDPSTPEAEEINTILKATNRAADITKQLLGFARKGKYNPVPLNINEVIVEAVSVIEKMIEKNIKVVFSLEEKINTIKADKGQLNQVFTNLIINARDTMPLGGELTLKTENIHLGEAYSKKYFEMREGYYVKISITDTGIGIPEAAKPHIFEPFFTTKGESVRTGLGLAMVYGIVKNHDGYINVYCEPTQNTAFNLYFPISEEKIPEIQKRYGIVKSDETILVMDDEEDVRTVSKVMLEELGYKVYLAKNGLEAIQIYKDKKDEIDLIILDMIMPGLNCHKTYQGLKEIDPDVKVLLANGYSSNGKAEGLKNEGVNGFVQKPFMLHELSSSIAEITKNPRHNNRIIARLHSLEGLLE